MFDDVEQFAQPAILQAFGARRAVLVAPMRGDAQFGHFMHVGRADLNFDALALRTDDAGMQGFDTGWASASKCNP